MDTATIKNKVQTATISAKKFVEMLITMVVLLVSFWESLDTTFKVIFVVVCILFILDEFTGLSKLDFKKGLETALELIKKFKENHPDSEIAVLNALEVGITSMVGMWDKINTALQKTKGD